MPCKISHFQLRSISQPLTIAHFATQHCASAAVQWRCTLWCHSPFISDTKLVFFKNPFSLTVASSCCRERYVIFYFFVYFFQWISAVFRWCWAIRPFTIHRPSRMPQRPQLQLPVWRQPSHCTGRTFPTRLSIHLRRILTQLIISTLPQCRRRTTADSLCSPLQDQGA